jgi:predicted AlkP superfamily pyrophosphatase or phosphodiesterase
MPVYRQAVNFRFRLNVLFLLLCSMASLPGIRVHAAAPEHDVVVMISVDGLANFYLDDPKAEMPVIRRLAAEGARADSMMPSMPTVTWPNHTTLVTGVTPAKHGVLGNSVLDRANGDIVPLVVDPIFNKDELVKAPTIYDVAKRAGLKTAALLWPASRGAPTLDWTIPDVGSLALTKQFATPSLLEECAAEGIPWDKQEEWWETEQIRERDRMFVNIASLVLRRHRPHLMLMHLVELDHAQHRFGPRSPQAYAALKNQDDCVGKFWQELQQACPGRATLLVVSDHGFVPYNRQILPNVLLHREGLLTTVGSKITGGSVRALAQGGSCFIYVREDAKRAELIARITPLFRDVEGVGLVLTAPDFAAQGLPDPARNAFMADMVLSAKPGYGFADLAAGDVVVAPPFAQGKGIHGSDASQPDMQATFVAWGTGIKRGAKLGAIKNTSVAPTLAALLGLKMPGADGPVLDGILDRR